MNAVAHVQWRTLLLFAFVYISWIGLTLASQQYSAWFVTPLLLVLALHSSLQHEVIHGHSTPGHIVNSSMASPAPGLFLPFERFEYLHLQHHRDWLLTNPIVGYLYLLRRYACRPRYPVAHPLLRTQSSNPIL